MSDPAATARGLIRAHDTAALASGLGEDGWPYASLVLVACDHDASPLLLISQLAEHTRNIARDSRVSLLFDGTAGLDSRLTGARVSVLGQAVPDSGERTRRRFLARHRDAAGYADFADFGFYRIEIARAHLVAGFGQIEWIDGAAVRRPDDGPLPEQEPDIIAHMNTDHADAVQLYATRLLGADGAGWEITGLDAEGADLRRGGTVLRLPFDKPVGDAEAARVELVRLLKRARGTPS